MKKFTSKLIIVSFIVIVCSCLLMVNYSSAKIKPAFSIKVTKEVTPWPPHLGDVLEIVYTVQAKYDLDSIYISHLPVKGASVISYLEPIGFRVWEKEKYNEYYKKLQGINRLLWFTIKKGEEKKFRLRVKLDEKVPEKRIKVFPIVGITVGVKSLWTKEHGDGVGHQHLGLYLLDEKAGLLGTKKEYGESLPLEYRYDACDGIFVPPGTPVNIEQNRKIIQIIKKLEPALSDSEALCLHSDIFNENTPYKYIGPILPEKTSFTDEEIFGFLLERDWLEKYRAGDKVKREWLKQLSEENRKKVEEMRKKGIWENPENRKEGSNLNFFRGDDSCRNSSGVTDFPEAEGGSRYVRKFTGQWKYKDHRYNKEQGLLPAYDIKTPDSIKVRIFLCYFFQSTLYREYSQAAITDTDGNFCVITYIPYNVDTHLSWVCPVIFPAGPDTFLPLINVSDPNITIPSYWKDPIDPTLFPMRELGLPTVHYLREQWYDDSIHLGEVWTDTFPAVSQPQSGCINIYETLIHARTFTFPPSTDPLRVMWEPGYTPTQGTAYIFGKDTMYVQGWTSDTDEWDDDILYHEFGHYQMDFYNNGLDPWQTVNYNPGHQWWLNDVDHQATAWIEGWADFFSGRARVGSGTDTLFVNTDTLIGKGQGYHWYYFNLEDPWKHKDSLTHPFEGGQYCEGAVAGILFDVYDAYNEIPYPRDPLRSDSMTRDFNQIFHIMHKYNPSGGAYTHCGFCFQFYVGWKHYNYGEVSKLLQIFDYHGVFTPAQPNPPQNFGVHQEPQIYGVIGNWGEPVLFKDLYREIIGYLVYRLDPDTSDFQRLFEDPITDTFYIDTDVSVGKTYSYYVTSVDSFGIESHPSDTVTWTVTRWLLISDIQSSSSFGKKITKSNIGEVFVSYFAYDSIYCVSTLDAGVSWTGDVLGEGVFPSIALDGSNEPNVVWMWHSPPQQPSESRLYFSRDTGSGWTAPYELWVYPYASGVPCFAIDTTDSGRVVWDSYFQFFPNGHSAISYGSFNTQDISPVFYDTLIDDDFVEPGCKNPSIAIDSTNFDYHVVYSKDDDIYYVKVTPTGWTTPELLSDSMGNSIYPYIDYETSTDRLGVVWQTYIGGIYQILHCGKTVGAPSWPIPDTVCFTSYNSINPVITGGDYAFWSEAIPGNSEIYYSKYNGINWETPVLVKSTPEASMYPQVTHTPGSVTDTVFVAWTDGDSVPYIIEFEKLNIAKTLRLSGHISSDLIIDRDAIVIGDVWVDSGVTVTVNPGVTIYFDTTDNQHAGLYPEKAELIVNGILIAQGTKTDSIRFTSPSTTPGDWGHIRFISSGTEGSAIEYSIIEYARYGIRCDNASPTIKHSLIQKNAVLGTTAGGGILAFNSSSIIEHNTIIYNGSEATTKSKEPKQIVRKSHSRFFSEKEKNIYRENFEDSLDIGIYARESKLSVFDNYISHNGTWGILAFREKGGVYELNTICNNFHNLHIALGDSCEVEISNNILTCDSMYQSEVGLAIEAGIPLEPEYRYVKLQAYKNRIIDNNQGIAMMFFLMGTPSVFDINITDNTIEGNTYGSYLWGSDVPDIRVNYTYNIITNNDIGFWFQGIHTTGKNTIVLGDLTNTDTRDDGKNRIFNNKSWNIYYSQDADTLMAQGNIWDSCDAVNIDNTIYDNDENPNSGPVNFDGFYLWGPITSDTTWWGTIRIGGDVRILNGTVLTILLGTELRFAAKYDATHGNYDTTLSELVVEGELNTQGTGEELIIFTSDAPVSQSGDWHGIRFVEPEKSVSKAGELEPILSQPQLFTKKAQQTVGKAIEDEPHLFKPIIDKRIANDCEPIEKELNENAFEEIVKEWQRRGDERKAVSVTLENVTIEYAKRGITYLRKGYLRLENAYIRDCSESGLLSEAPVWLKDGEIIRCDSVGVHLGGRDGLIWGTTISQNGIGILASGMSVPNIGYVDLSENNIGIFAEGESRPLVSDSRIVGNSSYGIYITGEAKPNVGGKGHNYIYGSGLFDLYNNTSNKIQARRNWWGTMEIDSVQAHIYDYYDDNTFGVVEVEPLWDGNKGVGGAMSSGRENRFIYSFSHPSPNPFVNNVIISYSIAKPGNVSLQIYDISGRLIKTLVQEKKEAGIHRVKWSGCDNNNRKVATGVYFTRLKSGTFTSVKKVIFVR